MSRFAQSPVVFFAFANDRVDRARYLRSLPEEQRRVREALAVAVRADLCEVVERPNATVEDVLDVFQDARYRGRVAVFHFGGHAGDAELLFESPEGASTIAHARGLANFLGAQRSLELVFLNGCSTQGQAQGLLGAGVPALIATSDDIDDELATELSSRFYKALASGLPIRTAFTEATAAVQTRNGDLKAKKTYRHLVAEEEASNQWPWALYVMPEAEERVKLWSLRSLTVDSDLPRSRRLRLNWIVGFLLLGVALTLGALLQPLSPDSPRPPQKPALYAIRVQVLDPQGRPVAGSIVRASAGNEPLQTPEGWWEVQIPAAKAPAGGWISLWADHEEWEGSRVNLRLDKDPNPCAEIRLKVPEAWVRGRVVDEKDRALLGVRVTRQDGAPGEAITDADGRFALKLAVPRGKKIRLRSELAGSKPGDDFCYTGRDSCTIVLEKK